MSKKLICENKMNNKTKTIIKKLLGPYLGLRRELYIIFISKTVNALGAFIGPFMTLLLSKKIGLSSGETGIYVAVTGLIYIPSSILGGKLSDAFGRKKILLIFEFIAALGYIICAFIPPSMIMVPILMLVSICFGIAGPSNDAMTADLTTPEQRQGAFSLNYLGFNFGFAIAQIFAGMLFEEHINYMFLIDAATAIFSLILIALFVKETLHNVQYDESEVEEEVYIKTEEDTVNFSTLKVFLSRPILLYFAIATFGYKFVYSQWSFMIPLHAEHNFVDQGAKLYGILGTINATIVVVMTPVITLLFHRRTHIRRIIYAGILFTAGFSMLGFISTKAAFVISVVIFTLGEILEAISSVPFIMSHTPASHRGRIGSITSILIGSGYVLGTVVMGQVLEYTSFENCWMISGSVVLISTILMKLLEVYDNKRTNKNLLMVQEKQEKAS